MTSNEENRVVFLCLPNEGAQFLCILPKLFLEELDGRGVFFVGFGRPFIEGCGASQRRGDVHCYVGSEDFIGVGEFGLQGRCQWG